MPKKVKSESAKKSGNPWIAHVKKYAKDNNLTYREAMSKAKASYNK